MASRSRGDTSFKKGDRVEARWSGSNKFYEAKILETSSRSYKVQFDDGSVSSVKIADVKKLPKEKSETKREQPKRQASKSKSRSRSRSRGGPNRSRSRSPARKEKKASKAKADKKSSADEKKSPTTNNVDEADSPVKTILTRNKIGLKDEAKKETTFFSQSTNSFLSKEFSINLDRPDISSAQLRTSARLANFKFAESSLDKATKSEKVNAVKKDDGKYSDEESSEEEVEVVKKPSTRLSLQILYFTLTFSRIIILPLAMLFLVFTCTKKQCTVLEVPPFYSGWRSFGNSIKYPIASILAFHTVLCALSFIPAGKKQTGFATEHGKRQQYCLNGLFCLVTFIVAFSVASYFDVYSNWGYDKFKSTALSALIYCVCCSLILHIVSLIKGNGDKYSKIPLIGNFYDGIYINPFVFNKIDVKTSFIRAGLIGSVLLNSSILLKYFLMKGTVTIPLASTILMQLIFVLDFFIKEETMLSSATYTTDTVGYSFILTSGFLVPFGLVLDSVYLFNFEAKANAIPHYCSGLIAVLFLLGYYLYRSSNNIKHSFRKNPYTSSSTGIDSLPTSKKKRLICSGLWGKIRHPNYVGLFLMVAAWTLPCGFSHLVPYVPLIMLFVALVVRCFRIERECKEKYGPSWTCYTEKARKRFIPYVF